MFGDPTKDEDSAASGGVEATRRRSAELFAALRDDSAQESTRDEAREGLVHLHLPLVEHLARRYSGAASCTTTSSRWGRSA